MQTDDSASARNGQAASSLEAEGPAKPGSGKPSRRPLVILGIVFGVVMIGVIFYAIVHAGKEDTDDAQVTVDLVPVAARVAGAVARVPIVENQRVAAGDVMVELDPADYAAKVKQAEAELAIARAQATAADAQVNVVVASSRGGLTSAQAAVSGSTVGVGAAEAQVAAARAGLERAQADQTKADTDLRRARELDKESAIPKERLDDARSAAESARAQVSQAKANLSAAEEARRAAEARVGEAKGRLSQSSPVDAQIAAARAAADLAHARVQSAEAALDLARLQHSYTRIVAPEAGVASRLSAHPGQFLGVGQPAVELVPDRTYVVANFKETQIGRMRPGQRAEIMLDAYPGRSFEGKVESLSGGTGASFSLLPPDNASGNFVKVVQRVPVRIAWNPSPTDVHLPAGLSADVTVFVSH
jgi:membrane fusion protein (multidrug efflux system)